MNFSYSVTLNLLVCLAYGMDPLTMHNFVASCNVPLENGSSLNYSDSLKVDTSHDAICTTFLKAYICSYHHQFHRKNI